MGYINVASKVLYHVNATYLPMYFVTCDLNSSAHRVPRVQKWSSFSSNARCAVKNLKKYANLYGYLRLSLCGDSSCFRYQ